MKWSLENKIDEMVPKTCEFKDGFQEIVRKTRSDSSLSISCDFSQIFYKILCERKTKQKSKKNKKIEKNKLDNF